MQVHDIYTAALRLYFSFSKLSKSYIRCFVSVLTRVDIFIKLCKLMFTFLSTARSLPVRQTVFPIDVALIEINFLKDSVTQSLHMRHSSIVPHQLSVLICQSVIISKSLQFSGGPSLQLFHASDTFEKSGHLVWFYSSFCRNTTPLPAA